MEKWTESLRVGDVVARRGGGTSGRSVSLSTVVKLLPTQIVIMTNGKEERFNRNHLGLIGSDSWGRAYLAEADDRTRYEVKCRRMKFKFSVEVVGKVNSLTISEIEAMLNALEAHRENEKERP